MYKVLYQGDNGKKFLFDALNGVAFDMDLGGGVSVDLNTSQGFRQIGESIQGQSVGGKRIKVSGVVFEDQHHQKEAMRDVFAPLTSGKLIFGDYYIRVTVEDTPEFSTSSRNGKFVMRLYAPYPGFKRTQASTELIGELIPSFRFPINYSTPHRFGVKSGKRYANIKNGGNLPVPFEAHLSSSGVCTNIVLTNLENQKFLRLNGVLQAGETIDIYRDSKGILRIDKTSGGDTVDAFSMLDDDSNLFELAVGDNLISANDDEGGASLTAQFTFSPAVTAVYES